MPKGGGKSIRVKQATIDEMKKMGMTKALEKAKSGSASAEFVEGAKRMYPKQMGKATSAKPSSPAKSQPKPVGKSTGTKAAAPAKKTAAPAKPATAKPGSAGYDRQRGGEKAGPPVPEKNTHGPRVDRKPIDDYNPMAGMPWNKKR